MAQTLRPDQQRVKDLVKKAARHGARVILVRMPTGAGKTTVMASLIEDARAVGSSVWVVVHRDELAEQASERITGQGIEAGIVMGTAESTDPSAEVQIYGVQTLHNRIVRGLDSGKMPTPPRLMFVDEAHHVIAPTWARVMAYAKAAGAIIVLLSATPWDEAGRGLGVADALVDGPSPKELVDAGVLVEPTIFCGPTPDLSGVKVHGSDFAQQALADSTNQLVGDVVKHWFRHARDMATLAFAVNVEHSQRLIDEFRHAGVTAEHVDAKTPSDERRDIFQRLRSGGVKVVSNVGVVTEGFDAPNVEAVILARPTQSESLFLQMTGRGLRSAPGKTGLILLDHGYNCLRHGHPLMDRPVTLAGRGPRKKLPEKDLTTQNLNFRLCPNVDCMHACPMTARSCPLCGAEIKPSRQPKEKRNIDLVKFTELSDADRGKVKVMERRVAFYKMMMSAKPGSAGGWEVSYAYARRFGIMPHHDRIFFTKQEREVYWARRKKGPAT